MGQTLGYFGVDLPLFLAWRLASNKVFPLVEPVFELLTRLYSNAAYPYNTDKRYGRFTCLRWKPSAKSPWTKTCAWELTSGWHRTAPGCKSCKKNIDSEIYLMEGELWNHEYKCHTTIWGEAITYTLPLLPGLALYRNATGRLEWKTISNTFIVSSKHVEKLTGTTRQSDWWIITLILRIHKAWQNWH